eukprot:12590051-Ditylum_brightwellii.AAC.1
MSVTFCVTAAPLLTKFSGFAIAAAASATYAVSDKKKSTVQCDALPIYKHDGIQHGLIGDIIARFKKRGYKLVGLKMV